MVGWYKMSSPKSSPGKRSTTLQYLFDLDSKNPSPKNGDKAKQSSLSFESETHHFLSIISHCTTVFTFTDPTESPTEQDLKRLKLVQLLSMLRSPKKQTPEQVLPHLLSMISTNLFRPLPPSSLVCNSSAEILLAEEDQELASNLAPTWQHVQVVYDILIRLVVNTDPKILKTHIDNTFLVNLLAQFQTEDSRERESLKNVYHRIYSRFTSHRSFMRKSMNEVFLNYIFEGDRHCGISELLEIWGSIINGFTVPLKEEHKVFLMRVLIPLHKMKGMQVYHRQLSYCVNQFVQKEPMLGGVVVRGILRYWPVTNCQKEVLLIGELEELMENIDPDQYRKLALPLCTQITRCLNSWNSQVAERALYIWNNEQFLKMTQTALEDVFPVVVEGMEKNLKWHWSKSVKQLTENVKAMLEETDPILYQKCLQDMYHKEYLATQEETKRNQKWETLELQAASICVSH